VEQPDRIDIHQVEQLARHLGPTPGGGPLVSVDFDFFVRLPTADDLPAPVRDDAIDALDWTGDERVDAETAHAQWRARAAGLRQLGLDPGAVIGIDRRTPPMQVGAALHERFVLPRTCQAADSHAWGLLSVIRAFHGAGGPIQLISLDAHHDLGYMNDDADSPGRSRARRRTSACADDWIAVALTRGWVNQVTIVYPDWLGDFEWRTEPPTIGRRHLQRVTVTTWSRWQRSSGERPVASGLLAVRSSEWVPPWGDHDQYFLDLVQSLAPRTQWLDHIAPGIHVGAHRADVPRVAVA